MCPFAFLRYQTWVPINFTCAWVFSAHTQMQHQTPRPTRSLPGQGHFHPAHPQSTESLAILIYNKHTYFCNLSGDSDPCIVLKRQSQFVQSKLCSDPAVTPTCPSLLASPMVQFPQVQIPALFERSLHLILQAFLLPQKVLWQDFHELPQSVFNNASAFIFPRLYDAILIVAQVFHCLRLSCTSDHQA